MCHFLVQPKTVCNDILSWLEESLDDSKGTNNKFLFIDIDIDQVRCLATEDCPPETYCENNFCIEKSTVNSAMKRRLKPSANCPDTRTPCRQGNQCVKPQCNRHSGPDERQF